MTVKVEGDAARHEVWIFGFGSLIWRAGEVIFDQAGAQQDDSCNLSIEYRAFTAGFAYQKRVEGYIKNYRHATLTCAYQSNASHVLQTQDDTVSAWVSPPCSKYCAGGSSIRAQQITGARLKLRAGW